MLVVQPKADGVPTQMVGVSQGDDGLGPKIASEVGKSPFALFSQRLIACINEGLLNSTIVSTAKIAFVPENRVRGASLGSDIFSENSP